MYSEKKMCSSGSIGTLDSSESRVQSSLSAVRDPLLKLGRCPSYSVPNSLGINRYLI